MTGRRVSTGLLIAASVSLWCVLPLPVLAGRQEPPSGKYRILRDENLMVTMRDGTRLSTNVTRPDSPGKFLAIVLRTPYSKAEGQEVEPLAANGYVVVVQDCRGRFSSEGEFVPFFHEAEDGDDTITWVAAQAWSDGRVVTAGGSYSAMDQWLAATRHNPHLKGMISMVSPSDFYHGVVYEGGALNQAVLQMWSYFTAGGRLHSPASTTVPWNKVFFQLPVASGLSAMNLDVKFFRDWIAHPAEDGYWREIQFDKSYASFDFPVLHITGWYDMFQRGTIENFQQMHDYALPTARARQLLVVGPWGHNSFGRKVGQLDFGDKATPDVLQMMSEWLEHAFEGKSDVFFAKPVRVFTMGENAWHEYDSWPVPDVQQKKYFLHGSGASNGSEGSGTLTTKDPTANEKPDHYTYDPADPVPTRGGGNCCWPDLVAWGPVDQKEVEKRKDVLVYTSAQLREDLRVTGPIAASLWISSSAPDTDFTVKLVDVFPDGFVMNLVDGILRMRYRDSFEQAELLTPGKPYRITVELGNTSNLFKTGHRIRVEISSSNFPHFSRNTNTGRQPETDSTVEVARQTILHDSKHPSYVVLSLLP